MNCYIASQKRSFDLPEHLNKDNTLFFPETAMTTIEMLTTGRPSEYHIVTDCHFLVPLYSIDEVFFYNEKTNRWENPDRQTYGTSYNIILHEFWNHKYTIPSVVVDGNITNVMGYKLK